MAVERILCYSGSTNQHIILRDAQGQRRLTLTTGYFEAAALWWLMTGESNPRPLTHEAWLGTVISLGYKVESACVHDRREDTYFAEIRLCRGGEIVRVDVRPSDALLLSLRAGVPFCFTEQLLARCAVSGPEPA
jgi:bifunctional DNase/RNase